MARCETREILKTNRQTELAIHTDQHSALLYKPDISVWKTADIEEHPFLKRIGLRHPEPQTFTWRAVADRLRKAALSQER